MKAVKCPQCRTELNVKIHYNKLVNVCQTCNKQKLGKCCDKKTVPVEKVTELNYEKLIELEGFIILILQNYILHNKVPVKIAVISADGNIYFLRDSKMEESLPETIKKSCVFPPSRWVISRSDEPVFLP